MGTSTFRIDDEVTDDSAEQMITKITHAMNVNIMPNILATWNGTNWLNTKNLLSMLVMVNVSDTNNNEIIRMKILRSMLIK